MNLTELKDALSKQLGLSENVSAEKVLEAVLELGKQKDEAMQKLETFKQEHNISELKEEDFANAAAKGMKITGSTTIFVSPSLQTFALESYCKENSKGFYYKAEAVGKEVKLTKIQR